MSLQHHAAIALILLISTASGSPASAQTAAAAGDQRPGAAFRGLSRLGVVLEGLSADAEKCGLKQDVLESAVLKKLTDAGFRVARNSDEDTYLYVNVNSATPLANLCVSRYDVTIYSQTVGKLSHTASSVPLQVELLHKGGLAGGSPAAHAEGVTKGVLDATEQFAAQIRSAMTPTP